MNVIFFHFNKNIKECEIIDMMSENEWKLKIKA